MNSMEATTKIPVAAPGQAARIAVTVPEISTITVTDQNDALLTQGVATPGEPWKLYEALQPQVGSPAVDPGCYPLTITVTYQAEGALVPPVSVMMWSA